MSEASTTTILDETKEASAARDWPRAAALWDRAIAEAPDDATIILPAAQAHWDAGNHARATELLEQASLRFGARSDWMFFRAHFAMRVRDFAASAAHWAAHRAAFPNEAAGYVFGAVATREMRHFADADHLLEDAQRRFPGDAGAFIEHAWVAHAQGFWDQALERWTEARTRFPTNSAAYRGYATTLKAANRSHEADAALTEAVSQMPDNAGIACEWAMQAQGQRDWATAVDRWAQVRQRFPQEPGGYVQAALALRELARFDEAEALLRVRMTEAPGDSGAFVEYAWVAHVRGEWLEALTRWDLVRETWPRLDVAWRRAAEALKQLGRADEAEDLLTQAVVLMPHEPGPWIDRAQLAAGRADWGEAARRWASVRERFCNEWIGFTGGAQALREAGDIHAAEALLEEGLRQDPAAIHIAAEFAKLAETRNLWGLAALRWQWVVERFAHEPAGFVGLAQALRRQGRANDAEQMLQVAMKDQIGSEGLMEEYALIAMAREDWPEAMKRLMEAQRRFPLADVFRRRVFEVRLRLAEGSVADDVVASDDVVGSEAARRRSLLMNFESLGGGGHGCEFGIFQRSMGAEPLGLLRWTDIFQDELTTLLETRFAGVGDPEFTIIFVPTNAERPEYWTRDKRYHMAMRSFVYCDEVSLERFSKQVRSRFDFLKRKIISDLIEGNKIFVYKNMKRSLTASELSRLHRAIRSYGPSTFLYIKICDTDNEDGSVVVGDEGLLIGYVSHFSHDAKSDEFLGHAHDSL